MTIQDIHRCFLKCSGISIDTRKINTNDFFVALKGANFDANSFAAEALNKGAAFVLIDNPGFYVDERTILVDDCLSVLQELAQFHRNYLGLPIISLTGSNGKTTTKELINVVLSKKINVKATVGNLNNHIGVPLTLLSFTSDTEMGIVEMGANHQKEIEFLCAVAQPDYGYITNFGKAHLEGFGGIEGVIKGKSEMYQYLKSNSKTVFVNLDDVTQEERTREINRITFSRKEKMAGVFIEKVSADPFVEVDIRGVKIKSNLIGLYNTDNINAAITIGLHFGVPLDEIKNAIETYFPQNNRSQIIKKDSNEIILDAYNANPSSIEKAVLNLKNLDRNKKVAILGDMFELGSESLQEHQNIVSLFKDDFSVDCYFVGKDFYANKIEQSNLFFYEDFESLSEALKNLPFENTTILIKGSRGMALERTLECL